MRTTQLNILILLIIIPIQLKSQENNRLIGIGLNLPPIFGNTIALHSELSNKKLYSFSLSIGGMLNNKTGTFFKKEGWTFNESSSGLYSACGSRFTLRLKSLNSSYCFIGAKLFFGYFFQSAEYRTPIEEWFSNGIIPNGYSFNGNRVYTKGWFSAFAIETGYNIKMTQRIHLEIGLQVGFPFYNSKMLYAVLPGMGSVIPVVGILEPKFIIGKLKKKEMN